MSSDVSIPKAVPVNVTLKGYHVPTLTPDQLTYTGAIAGEIRTYHGFYTEGVNVSLWRDERIVELPDNPQFSLGRNYSGQKIDYLFEHLAPGRYTVRAIGYDSDENVSVDVGDRTMRADIVMSQFFHQPAGVPDISFYPTVGDFSVSSTSKPTTDLPAIIVLFVIGIIAYFMLKNKH
jgi:hypothetical protein